MNYFPPISREAVMTSLFTVFQTLLAPAGPFNHMSRKLKLWDEVPPEMQPALYMVEHTERPLQSPRGLPKKAEWEIMLFIYAKADTDDKIGSVILNNLIDEVEGVLQIDNQLENNLTLGGIVYRIWVDGLIRKDPGDLEGQALALYPIKIRPP
jgi:hypothetical protein